MDEPTVERVIHYFFHGAPRRADHEIDHNDPSRVDLHPQAFGFIFEEHTYLDIEQDGQEKHLCSHDFSPVYFVGQEYDRRQLSAELPPEEAEPVFEWMGNCLVDRLVLTPMGTLVSPEDVLRNFFEAHEDPPDLQIVIMPASGVGFQAPDFVPDGWAAG